MRGPAASALVIVFAAWPVPAGAARVDAAGDCIPGTAAPGAFRPRAVSAREIYVHDGDTFYVGREAIRLRGVDAPELEEPGGLAAKARLRQLLRAGPVTIIPRLLDAYCRTLADVRAGGRDVAEVLRQEGLARPRAWRPRRPRSR